MTKNVTANYGNTMKQVNMKKEIQKRLPAAINKSKILGFYVLVRSLYVTAI